MEKKHQQEEYVDFVVTARKYKTLLTAKYKSRPMWHKPSAGDVVSHLPGTIIKIMVEEGQAVEAGQLLLIHEAMKMQNRVVAPISGVVVELNVKEGDYVLAGDNITKGPLNPNDILRLNGVEGVYQYLLKEVQRVYKKDNLLIFASQSFLIG